MSETPAGLYYPPETGQAPDVPADMKKAGESVEDFVDARLSAPKGQLLIAQNTGAAAFKAMKGDATLAEDGTLTIGAGVISSSKLASGAALANLSSGSVTPAKLQAGAALANLAAGSIVNEKMATASVDAHVIGVLPGARVFNEVDTEVPGATKEVFKSITWAGEQFDNGGMHNAAENTSRLTAPIAGIYTVSGAVRMGAGSTNRTPEYLRVLLNGATIIDEIGYGWWDAEALVPHPLSLSTHIKLAIGDYVELQVAWGSKGDNKAAPQSYFAAIFHSA